MIFLIFIIYLYLFKIIIFFTKKFPEIKFVQKKNFIILIIKRVIRKKNSFLYIFN